MKRATCRSCGAAVVWAWTRKRARFPLDSEPIKQRDYSGNPASVYALVARGGDEPFAVSLRDISGGVELWGSEDIAGRVSHFATCPNAAQHRKPREPGTQLARRAS